MEEVKENYWQKLISIMAKLRSEVGCPWDKEQTHESLTPYLIEEAYEVLEALREGSAKDLCEELGDVLLQVVFHAQIASENGDFTINDVVDRINEKLIRRHPHVFSDWKVDNAEQVVENWEKIKLSEKRNRRSVMEGIPKGLPALLEAQRIQKKAAECRFDWDEAEGPLAKIKEEVSELEKVFRDGAGKDALEDEVGDVLFSVVNFCRHVKVISENALLRANRKFSRRFSAMLLLCQEKGLDFSRMTLEEMDQLWEECKAKNAKKEDKRDEI